MGIRCETKYPIVLMNRRCDAQGCEAHAQVEAELNISSGPYEDSSLEIYASYELPEGWTRKQGGREFCPKHT